MTEPGTVTTPCDPRVVYVTRKFPPEVGGMETLAEQIWRALRHLEGSELLALGRGQRNLVWWAPLTAARLLRRCTASEPPAVLVGDAATALMISPVLLAFRRTTVVLVVHGLDLIWPPRWYQRLVPSALRRADAVIANSRATAHEAAARGADPACITVINPEVSAPTEPVDRRTARAEIRSRLGVDSDSTVVITVGRLIPRKGVAWFVEQVLPELAGVVYVVVGDGPDAVRIVEAAKEADVAERVHLVGRADDRERELLLAGADVFAMPNVQVAGDMEGFGLVAVEAALRGLPIVASRIEGISDAVVDGQTGTLCEPGDIDTFARAIEIWADRRATAEASDPVVRLPPTGAFAPGHLREELLATLRQSRLRPVGGAR